MLRITEVADGGSAVLLKVEGKLREPWVAELAGATRRPSADADSRVRLDLSAVTYVDEAGIRLLRELARQGVEIAATSGFVAALLRLEDR